MALRIGLGGHCLTSALALCVGGTTGALAQSSPQTAPRAQADASDTALPEESPPLQDDAGEIIVTGSRVPRTSADTPASVQVIDRENLARFGASQLQDVIRAIPSNTGSKPFSVQENAVGTNQFNLRGLGYSSTLTLLNGRRAGVSPFTDASGGNFVDINQCPLAMIERIEVLKDGASAIYGSEAVAGVVNIITRTGFRGFELSGQIQDAKNTAGNVNMALGIANDRGALNIYATYFRQGRVLPSEYDWNRERLFGDGDLSRAVVLSGTGNPSTLRRAVQNANGTFARASGAVATPDPDCMSAGGIFRANANGTFDRTVCRFNIGDSTSLISDEERRQVFAEFNYDIGESVEFFGEGSYSRNSVRQNLGPVSFRNGLVSGTLELLIPGNHPFNFFVADPASAGRVIYIGPDNWNPTTHRGVDLAADFRPFGSELTGRAAPDRVSVHTYTRAVSGFRTDLGDRWKGEISYQYAEAANDATVPLNYKADVLNQLVLSGAFNPFGTNTTRPTLVSPKDGRSVAGNSQAVIDQFVVSENFRSRTVQHVADLTTTYATPLFGLDLAVAAGAQYRSLELTAVPDALRAAGEDSSAEPEFARSGQQDVWAAFAEANVRVSDRAELQFAVRHEDYGKGVGSTTDPQVAARISLGSVVTLRGRVGTSFQAPTLNQTTTTLTRTFLNDPVGVGPNGLVCGVTGLTANALVSVSGGDDLKPQSSTNYSAGVALTPARGLRFGADYWRYDYRDLIAPALSAQAIVNADCSDDGIPNDPRVTRDASGRVTQIDSNYVNIGSVETAGIDLSLVYDRDIARVGRLGLFAEATYVERFRVDNGRTPVFDGVGSRNATNNFFPIPDWRYSAGVSFATGSHSASLIARYIAGYKNDQSNNARVKSQTTVDVQYSLDLGFLGVGEATTLSLGADNVFDVDPPALLRADAAGNLLTFPTEANDRPGYDPLAGHSLQGRTLYLRLLQRF